MAKKRLVYYFEIKFLLDLYKIIFFVNSYAVLSAHHCLSYMRLLKRAGLFRHLYLHFIFKTYTVDSV